MWAMKQGDGWVSLQCFRIVCDIVSGLSKLIVYKDGVCKGCALQKYHSATFLFNDRRSKGVPHLTHSNVYGPMPMDFVTWYLYYVTFIVIMSLRSCA